MALERGTRIGPYEIAELIGKGGMGEVYRAHDERLGRDVAVKLMSVDASGDVSRIRRMQQEARAVGQLNHPNIVSVFDVGMHEERMYVVTELLSGESLRHIVERGALPWRVALGYALQMAEGLAAAHDLGIVHRDIKPDNLFVTKDKRVKILDFGIATRREPERGALASGSAQTVSQAGLLIGTVGYMSPEQARAQSVDHRTDIFALGCVLYELLTGKQAFTGPTPLEVLVAIQRDAPVAIQDVVPQVPADLVRIVERCLEKDAALRFQSARDLLFAMTLLQTAGPSSMERPAEPSRPAPKRRIPWPALAILALGLVLGAVIMAWRVLPSHSKELVFYRQMTFRRGTVYTARFTLDGTSIVYSAAWDGLPRELFATVAGAREARPMNLPETDAAFMLTSGEMGLIRRTARGFAPGTLGRMSLSGGPSKDMLDGIRWADSSLDGTDLVVVKNAGNNRVLEWPPGHAVTEAFRISYPRLSPNRQWVAFLEASQQYNDSGRLIVVDRNGKRVLETGIWKSIEGLAWRNDNEIWFGASKEGRSLWLHATDLQGKTRLLCRVPGRLVLHDLYRDGRILAERNAFRATLMVGTSGATGEKDLSWRDYSQLGQLSRDGKQMLFAEEGDGAGAGSVAYLRSTDGSVPLRLGEGLGLALSPDGTKALLRVGDESMHWEIVPIGAGTPETLPSGALTTISWGAFVPNTARIVILGREKGKNNQLYVQDAPAGEPRALAVDDVNVTGDALSPDGTVIAATQKGKVLLVPIDGSAPRELPGLEKRVPVSFTADGKTLFVRTVETLPLQLERYDLAAGKLETWKTLAPSDPAGLLSIGRVSIARDGEVYAYESYRLLSDLYIIENVE